MCSPCALEGAALDPDSGSRTSWQLTAMECCTQFACVYRVPYTGHMPVQRLRVTFGKGAAIKYISHLDLCLAWERALRRAGVPLAYSQGYNPRARLQFAAALPVGYTGAAELMDVLLDAPLSPEEFATMVVPALPAGLTLVTVEPISLDAPSLQSKLHSAEYRVRLETSVPPDELATRVANLLRAERCEQPDARRSADGLIDIRPLIQDLRLETSDGRQAVLWMRLSAGARGHLRPEAVLTALGVAGIPAHIERIHLDV